MERVVVELVCNLEMVVMVLPVELVKMELEVELVAVDLIQMLVWQMVGPVLWLVAAVEREYGEKVVMVLVEEMTIKHHQLVVKVVQDIG